MIVDAFSHIMPKKFLEAAAEVIPSQHKNLILNPYYSKTSADQLSEIEQRIDIMDKFSVEISVLTLHQPPIWNTINSKAYMKLCRIANDSVAEIAEEQPERFIGVATIPFIDENSVDELKRCVKDLGLRGIQIFSNSRGKPVDSPEHLHLYEEVSRLDIPIWIHPQSWPHHSWLSKYALDTIFGWPYETCLAMSRIVFSGIFEKYPNLKIITHHLGGVTPHFGFRVKGTITMAGYGAPEFQNAQFPELSKHPLEYFKAFFNDTAVDGSRNTLMCGYSFFGADHMVFGADFHKYGWSGGGEIKFKNVIANINELDIPLEEKNKIFETNARQLLKIK